MISYILFDMDNTLYPESSYLGETFEAAINSYVSRYLQVSEAEAKQMRHQRGGAYGTTLQWLVELHGFTDIDAYMNAVHPTDMARYLKKNPLLVRIIRALPTGKSILTNAPLEHALRVLEYLEIADQFDKIFDLRYNNFVGKPDPGVYERILKELGRTPQETLFIDDVPGYLEPFRAMGGHALLIDELQRHPETAYPVIERIEELPGFLRREYGIEVPEE